MRQGHLQRRPATGRRPSRRRRGPPRRPTLQCAAARQGGWACGPVTRPTFTSCSAWLERRQWPRLATHTHRNSKPRHNPNVTTIEQSYNTTTNNKTITVITLITIGIIIITIIIIILTILIVIITILRTLTRWSSERRQAWRGCCWAEGSLAARQSTARESPTLATKSLSIISYDILYESITSYEYYKLIMSFNIVYYNIV